MADDFLILVVDDDPDIVDALRLTLEANGYIVLAASSGQEALERIPECRPDLIVLDVMMENDTAGFQTAYRLRNPASGALYEGFEAVPIVMLTSISEEKKMSFSPDDDGAFLPVDVWLEKPVHPEKLLKEIGQLLKTSAVK